MMLELALVALCSVLILVTGAALADVLRTDVRSHRCAVGWIIAIIMAPALGVAAWYFRGHSAVAAARPSADDLRRLHDGIDAYLRQR